MGNKNKSAAQMSARQTARYASRLTKNSDIFAWKEHTEKCYTLSPFPSPSGIAHLALIAMEKLVTPGYNLGHRTESPDVSNISESVRSYGQAELGTACPFSRGMFVMVGGNRRKYALTAEGYKAMWVLLRHDVKPQDLFVQIDEHRKKHSNNDYLKRYFFAGKPLPTNVRREIENAEAIIGLDLLKWLRDQDGSMFHYRAAKSAAIYCGFAKKVTTNTANFGFDPDGDVGFFRRLLKWMVTHHQVTASRTVIERKFSRDLILDALNGRTNYAIQFPVENASVAQLEVTASVTSAS